MVKKKDSFKQLYVSVPEFSQKGQFSVFSASFGKIFSFKDLDLLKVVSLAFLSFILLVLAFSASILFLVLFIPSLLFCLRFFFDWLTFELVKKDFEENGIF